MTKPTPKPKEHGTGRWAKSHGARALAKHLAAGTLDRRTGVARDLEALQDGLATDRGGWANTTTAERMLIELASAELLIIRSLFAWAARQPSIIADTEDGPRLVGPLAKGFTSHAGALTRALGALGVRPDKVERLPDLQSYLANRAQAPPARPTPPTDAEVPTADADAAAPAPRSDTGTPDAEPKD
jgi:hypothetical protein